MIKKTLSVGFFIVIGLVIFSNQAVAVDISTDKIEECKSLEDNKPKEAISLAEQLLARDGIESSPKIHAEVLGCLAWSLAVDNQSGQALYWVTEMESKVQVLDESEYKIDLLRRVGGIYHRMGNRIAAVDNYQMAMTLAESMNNKQKQIPILINLGVLHSQIREHEQAIRNYYMALDLMAELDDFTYQAPVLFNLATTLNGQDRFAESLKIFKQIEPMMNDQWPKIRVALVYAGLASTKSGLNQYKEAKQNIEQSLQLLDEDLNQSLDYYSAQIIYANILTKLGEFEAAEQHADAAWAYFSAEENREQIISINTPLYSLASIYEDIDQPLLALKVHKLATDIEQDFQDSFNKKAMAQMQARLSDSQQRKELAELKIQQAKNQIQLNAVKHNRQLILLVGASVSILLLLYFYWQRQTHLRLRAISMRDSLTGLGNRRAIKEWLSSRKFPQPPHNRIMWLIDLDLFKDINDQYGHEAGDVLLKELGETFRLFINENRFVCRWGGEEFMLISDDIDWDNINPYCDQLLTAIKNTGVDYQGKTFSITASVGISQIEGSDKTAWHQALTTADKALYAAKDRGRNCVICG